MKLISVRVEEAALCRVVAVAQAADISVSEAVRALLERSLNNPGSSAAELPGELLETLTTIAQAQIESGEQQARTEARLQALNESFGRINQTLHDLATAVQKLYQPVTSSSSQSTQSAAPKIDLPATPPPSFTAWAASQGWLDGEIRGARAMRLKAEYTRKFGVAV